MAVALQIHSLFPELFSCCLPGPRAPHYRTLFRSAFHASHLFLLNLLYQRLWGLFHLLRGLRMPSERRVLSVIFTFSFLTALSNSQQFSCAWNVPGTTVGASCTLSFIPRDHLGIVSDCNYFHFTDKVAEHRGSLSQLFVAWQDLNQGFPAPGPVALFSTWCSFSSCAPIRSYLIHSTALWGRWIRQASGLFSDRQRDEVILPGP